MLGHKTGAPSEHHPGEKRTDEGIPYAYPCGGYTEFPAELSGVADEYNCGKVRRAVGKGSEPGTNGTTAQDKAVDVGSMLAAEYAHRNHNAEENNQHNNLYHHVCNTSFLFTEERKTGEKNVLCFQNRGRNNIPCYHLILPLPHD